MKRYLSIAITAFAIWAVSASAQTGEPKATIRHPETDSTEYEVIIDDLRFDQWYLTNYSDAKDMTNEYYRTKNQSAALSWNAYYRENRFPNVVDSYLYFQPDIDYGITVNRKLYWYFKYVQETYDVPLF